MRDSSQYPTLTLDMAHSALPPALENLSDLVSFPDLARAGWARDTRAKLKSAVRAVAHMHRVVHNILTNRI